MHICVSVCAFARQVHVCLWFAFLFITKSAYIRICWLGWPGFIMELARRCLALCESPQSRKKLKVGAQPTATSSWLMMYPRIFWFIIIP